LTGLDRWILGEFARLEDEILPAYEAYEFHAVYQKLSQFAAVELSAIYHDAVKDRLYTDPANSPRRRSTQTALHRMVTQLCQMLSPILVFTADEAWEFVPGRPKDAPHVHLATWEPTTLTRSETEETTWRRHFEIREHVLPHLEKARQAKTIGKALDARLTLAGSNLMLNDGQAHRESLRELLNVSQLEVHFAPAGGEPTLNVSVAKAAGQKCERCWHWEEDVGRVAANPTICGRCVEAVSQIRKFKVQSSKFTQHVSRFTFHASPKNKVPSPPPIGREGFTTGRGVTLRRYHYGEVTTSTPAQPSMAVWISDALIPKPTPTSLEQNRSRTA